MTAVCPRALMLVKAPSVDRRNSARCPGVWQPAPIRSTAQPLAESVWAGSAFVGAVAAIAAIQRGHSLHDRSHSLSAAFLGKLLRHCWLCRRRLTGLMFVVMELITGNQTRVSNLTISAFGTPTVVHFCVALLISATLSAPWHELANAGLALGISGTAVLIYVAIIGRRDVI